MTGAFPNLVDPWKRWRRNEKRVESRRRIPSRAHTPPFAKSLRRIWEQISGREARGEVLKVPLKMDFRRPAEPPGTTVFQDWFALAADLAALEGPTDTTTWPARGRAPSGVSETHEAHIHLTFVPSPAVGWMQTKACVSRPSIFIQSVLVVCRRTASSYATRGIHPL